MSSQALLREEKFVLLGILTPPVISVLVPVSVYVKTRLIIYGASLLAASLPVSAVSAANIIRFLRGTHTPSEHFLHCIPFLLWLIPEIPYAFLRGNPVRDILTQTYPFLLLLLYLSGSSGIRTDRVFRKSLPVVAACSAISIAKHLPSLLTGGSYMRAIEAGRVTAQYLLIWGVLSAVLGRLTLTGPERACLLIFFLHIILSLSRIQYLSLLLTLLAALALEKKMRKKVLRMVPLFLVFIPPLLLLISTGEAPAPVRRLKSRFSREEIHRIQIGQKAAEVEAVFSLFAEDPARAALGLGPGGRIVILSPWKGIMEESYLHNQFLVILAKFGVVGFLLYLIFLLRCLLDPEKRPHSYALLSLFFCSATGQYLTYWAVLPLIGASFGGKDEGAVDCS